MALSRYNFVKRIIFSDNIIIGSNRISSNIFNAVENGRIDYATYVLTEGERLDVVAGKFYNNATYWWIIAAANNQGRDSLVVKPGVQLRIPMNTTNIINQYNALNSTR